MRRATCILVLVFLFGEGLPAKKKPKEPPLPVIVGGVRLTETFNLVIADPEFTLSDKETSLVFYFVNDSPQRLDFAEIDFILYPSLQDNTILETTQAFLWNVPANSRMRGEKSFNHFGKVIALDGIKVRAGRDHAEYHMIPSTLPEPIPGQFMNLEAWRITWRLGWKTFTQLVR